MVHHHLTNVSPVIACVDHVSPVFTIISPIFTTVQRHVDGIHHHFTTFHHHFTVSSLVFTRVDRHFAHVHHAESPRPWSWGSTQSPRSRWSHSSAPLDGNLPRELGIDLHGGFWIGCWLKHHGSSA